MEAAAISDLLYNHSGLLGLSGISGDMRTLLASDHPDAAEAIRVFVYRIGRNPLPKIVRSIAFHGNAMLSGVDPPCSSSPG